MRRVIALELVGLKKLDCDLYDEDGKVVYTKGTEFSPEKFMMLTHGKIYKRDEEHLTLPLETITDIPKITLGKDYEVYEPLQQEAPRKSIISAKNKENLLNNIKNILKCVIDKKPLSIQECLSSTEIILEEVYTKFQKIHDFAELRVYDYYSFTHSINVAILSAIIGRELGYNDKRVKDLVFSALLHDIGKMQVPKEILYKPEILIPEEMQIIKKHAEYGYIYITKELNLPDAIGKVALSHHERWEGQGYPYGLKGNQISEFAQIVAIADVYDALLSDKVYKANIESIDAMKMLLTQEAKSFNPQVLNKFIYITVIKSDDGVNSLI